MRSVFISLIFVVSLLSSGCWFATTSNSSRDTEGKSAFWGTKNQVIDFLNSPQAKASRWLVESLGE